MTTLSEFYDKHAILFKIGWFNDGDGVNKLKAKYIDIGVGIISKYGPFRAISDQVGQVGNYEVLGVAMVKLIKLREKYFRLKMQHQHNMVEEAKRILRLHRHRYGTINPF